MRVTAILLMATATIGLAACDYDTEVATLSTVLTWMQIGHSQDQWLEQKNRLDNEWDKVALVFGYYDDYDGCSDFVEAMRVQAPRAQYRCVPAN